MTRRILGLDWFDVVVHVTVTAVAGAIVSMMFGGQDGEMAVALVLGISVVVLGIRRKRALAAAVEGPEHSVRLEDMESRLAELEQVQFRVAELEERLDFAERLLGQAREQERIPRG